MARHIGRDCSVSINGQSIYAQLEIQEASTMMIKKRQENHYPFSLSLEVELEIDPVALQWFFWRFCSDGNNLFCPN